MDLRGTFHSVYPMDFCYHQDDNFNFAAIEKNAASIKHSSMEATTEHPISNCIRVPIPPRQMQHILDKCILQMHTFEENQKPPQIEGQHIQRSYYDAWRSIEMSVSVLVLYEYSFLSFSKHIESNLGKITIDLPERDSFVWNISDFT